MYDYYYYDERGSWTGHAQLAVDERTDAVDTFEKDRRTVFERRLRKDAVALLAASDERLLVDATVRSRKTWLDMRCALAQCANARTIIDAVLLFLIHDE